jgi:hypothetical protein
MADPIERGHESVAQNPSEKCDQTFFLDLAAKGKDAWNAWRRDPNNKDVRVTFAGVDFSQAPKDQIDFSGFEFGDYADFSQCKWHCVAWPIGSSVSRLGAASFTGAVFGNLADFTGAVFGNWAAFNGAIFGDSASFAGANFGGFTGFTLAAFGMRAQFDGTVFAGLPSFEGAAFSLGATFEGAVFKGGVLFEGRSIERWTSTFQSYMHWLGSDDREALEKRHREAWKRYHAGPDRFWSISFANARFEGNADFSGRSVIFGGDFTNTRFYYPPAFDAVTNAARIDFTGAHIGFVLPGKPHWITDSRVPVRLRALRKFAEDTKNHDLERDLYLEERKAERGVYLRQRWEELKKEGWKDWPRNGARLIAHILWIGITGLYWALADYGRSFLRPFAWLIATGFFFYWRYLAVLAPIMAKLSPPDIDKYKQVVRMLAVGNAVPFVGPLTIDAETKKFLLCAGDVSNKCLPIPPEDFQLLVIAENLVSIALVFFVGLALRNYFKIK